MNTRREFVRCAMVVLVCLANGALVFGGQVPNPTITASADPYNGGYVAANVFDNGFGEFATSTNGAGAPLSTDPNNGTWIEFDFGAAATVDTFVNRTRLNPNDEIGDSRLIFSQDATFDGSDPVVLFRSDGVGVGPNGVGNNANGFIRRFTPQTARYVRWEVVTSIGSSQNLGARQMFFFDSPAGHGVLPSPTAYNGATPFSGYALQDAADGGNAGAGAGDEYASAGQGAGVFVDFDFSRPTAISGFDFFDREHNNDAITGFDLIFSNASNFSSVIDTRSYSRAVGGSVATSDVFSSVTAQYVRLDVTSVNVGASNAGISEIQFYTPALADPSVVSVSSQYNTTRYAVGHLFDDQLDSLANADWAGVGAGPHTVVVDFGQIVTLRGIDYANRRDTGTPAVDYADTITLAFSSDLDFTGDPTVLLNIVQDSELNGYAFAPKNARYVQVTVEGGGNVGGSQLDFLGVVPEPSTLALAAVGLAGLIRRRRRRR